MKLRDISKANPSYGCTARLRRGRAGVRCEKHAVVLAIGVEVVRAFCARHATMNCGGDWKERVQPVEVAR